MNQKNWKCDYMNSQKRYRETVKLVDIGAGQTRRTVDYGSEYIFKNSDEERLVWDTMSLSLLDKKVGDTFKIGYNVINERKLFGKMDYIISNVRLIK